MCASVGSLSVELLLQNAFASEWHSTCIARALLFPPALRLHRLVSVGARLLRGALFGATQRFEVLLLWIDMPFRFGYNFRVLWYLLCQLSPIADLLLTLSSLKVLSNDKLKAVPTQKSMPQKSTVVVFCTDRKQTDRGVGDGYSMTRVGDRQRVHA